MQRERKGIFTLAVLLVLVSSTLGCYEGCMTSFNNAMAQAQMMNQSASFQASCQALFNYIGCLTTVEPNCDPTMLSYVHAQMQSSKTSHTQSCLSAPSQGGFDCRLEYMRCNDNFNASYGMGHFGADDSVRCMAINNFTMCIETLLSHAACIDYANHAIGAVTGIKARFGEACNGLMDGEMARCMNGTMDCFMNFNSSFYPALTSSNMSLMCSAVSNYSDCVVNMNGDSTCVPYTGQAMASIHVLQQQHATACGQDGGRRATECFSMYKECYQHFNGVFNPHMNKTDINRWCASMVDYQECSNAMPQDCEVYVKQSMEGIDRMWSQNSQYCLPENKKIFSCTQLSLCNKNLIGNITMGQPESITLCQVLEAYFPCVESAVAECQLSGDGVAAVSFRALGDISSRYCRSVLTNPSIKNCLRFMQCHAGLELNNISPAMMVEGTYWCHYMQSSLMCSSELISAGQCPVENPQDLLSTISSLQQTTTGACTLTTPAPMITTPYSPTDDKTKDDVKDIDQHVDTALDNDNVIPSGDDDKNTKGKTDEQTGKGAGGEASFSRLHPLAFLAVCVSFLSAHRRL